MTNTLNKIMHDGDEYLLPDTTYTAGSGINIDQNNEISNTGVTSFNGNTGPVTYTAPVSSVNNNTGAVTVSEFTPSGTATTGYVVTKTANGYEWAAPSGGHSTTTVTLTSAGWSSKSQTVSATGVTASNTVIVSPAPSNINDYATNSVYCSAQGSGTLTFSCNTEPTVDIDVNVVILS